MLGYLLFAVSLTLHSSGIKAVFVFDLWNDLQQCNPSTPPWGIDISQLEFSQIENKTIRISGKVTFTQDYGRIVRLNIHSQRLQRGTWITGEISRYELDFCDTLMIPTEFWYSLFNNFQQQKCPYKAGHVEELHDVSVGSLGLPVPPQFAGDWKIYVELYVLRRGRFVKECMMLPVTILEV